MVAVSTPCATWLRIQMARPPQAVSLARVASARAVCEVNGSLSWAARTRFAIRRPISAMRSQAGHLGQHVEQPLGQ